MVVQPPGKNAANWREKSGYNKNPVIKKSDGYPERLVDSCILAQKTPQNQMIVLLCADDLPTYVRGEWHGLLGRGAQVHFLGRICMLGKAC